MAGLVDSGLRHAPCQVQGREVFVAQVFEGVGGEAVVVVRERPLGELVPFDRRDAGLPEHHADFPIRRADHLERGDPVIVGVALDDAAEFRGDPTGRRRTGRPGTIEDLPTIVALVAAPGVDDSLGLLVRPARQHPLDPGDDLLARTTEQVEAMTLGNLGIFADVGTAGRHPGWELVVGHAFRIGTMRILAASVFEGVVYHCYCLDDSDPSHPRLEVDAVLREGDADGPLLVHVADYKRMVGVETAEACLPQLRDQDRTEVRDGVEYLVFPLWERIPPGS